LVGEKVTLGGGVIASYEGERSFHHIAKGAAAPEGETRKSRGKVTFDLKGGGGWTPCFPGS